MTVRVVTKPSIEPLTLAEAKTHLRLEESFDDTYVTVLITAARQYIEKVCWRGLLLQTLELTLPSFRGEDRFELIPPYVGGANLNQPVPTMAGRFKPYIELVGGHLAATPSIVVTYLDPSGVQQTLDSAAYVVQGLANEDMCGRLWLNSSDGYTWPTTLDRFDAVKVSYAIGWTTAADVPPVLKQAMLLLISQMYEYRTPEITGTIATMLEFTIDALTSPYRFVRL